MIGHAAAGDTATLSPSIGLHQLMAAGDVGIELSSSAIRPALDWNHTSIAMAVMV